MSPARRGAKMRSRPNSKRSLLYGVAGLIVVALVMWMLASLGPSAPSREARMPEAPDEPYGDIGDASRDQLREILKQADDGDRPETP